MPTDVLLDKILNDFTNAAGTYYPQLVTWAIGVLATITLLQVGYLSVQAALSRDITGTLDILMVGIIRIAIVYTVMDHAWQWGTDLIQTGQQAGEQISGLSPSTLTPSGVYNLGLTLVNDLFAARSLGMWLHPIDDMAFVVVTLMVWMAWLCAAVIYLWLLIECVFVVAMGPIQLCFSTFEFTFPILFAYAGKLLALAVKVLVMLLVLAIGMNFVNQWITDLSGIGTTVNDHRIFYATTALVESILFVTMVWTLPNVASSTIRTHLGGGGSSGHSEMAAESTINTATGAASTVAEMTATGGTSELANYVQRKLSS